jgi:hypothetical protein
MLASMRTRRSPRPATATHRRGYRLQLFASARAVGLDRLLHRSEIRKGFVGAACYPDEVNQDHAGRLTPWHCVNWPDKVADGACSACTANGIIQELPTLRRKRGATPLHRLQPDRVFDLLF